MWRMKIFVSYVLLTLSVNYSVVAQNNGSDIGSPYIRNYEPYEYGAHAQNFAVIQDNRGLIYFGNFSGILEFDGVSWRTILTKQISKVSTLTKDTKGKIYVGARGEIGYLQPDSIGQMAYFSLMDKIPKPQHDFADVLYANASEQGVWFVTDKYIFLWNNSEFKIREMSNPVLSAFYVNSRIYYLEKNEGLKYIENDKVKFVENGNIFSETVIIQTMIEMPTGEILIGTGSKGLYILGNQGISPFETAADNYFMENNISCGTILRDSTYALGTDRGGVVVIKPNGSLKQIINKQSGLFDNNVNGMFTDNNHVLWLVLNNGISRLHTPSYLSFFGGKQGVAGGVTQILRNGSQLFFSTYMGLYYYDYSARSFNTINEINSSCWAMLKVGKTIIAATSKGVFQITNTRARMISPGFSLDVYRSKMDPSTILIGQTDGVSKISMVGNTLINKGKLAKITEHVNEIARDSDGNYWFVVPTKGLIRYNEKLSEPIVYFDDNRGLPSHFGNHISETSQGIVVTTQKGLYRYNKQNAVFEPMNAFNADTTITKQWFAQLVEDSAGNLWTNAGNEKEISFRRKTSEGKYRNESIGLLPVNDLSILSIYSGKDGVMWFGGINGIVRYDVNLLDSFHGEFPTLIRSVRCNRDSLIFGGTYFNENMEPVLEQNSLFESKLDYLYNTISFEFAAPSFNINENLKFQFYLDGFDKDWMSWSDDYQKEYTNLPAGNYIFKVRAKNIYNQISTISEFKFSINKPFYQTWSAYFLYFLVGSSVVVIVVRVRSQKLIREKKNLENLILERTEEVVMQKEEIEKQSVELGYKNDELRKINLIVKAINSEIEFEKLLQTILERTKIIRAVERATMLVHDNRTDLFLFKAGYGWDVTMLESVQLTLDEAEERYLENSVEIFEDIFSVKSISGGKHAALFEKIEKPKSVLIMLVRVNDKIEGLLILENMHKKRAFDERDFSLLKNLKEHVISAFIKTNILEDLQNTLDNLKETQEQLIRQEKLASIGQLTKGIVDRILNPLNYINNFSMLTRELTNEIKEILQQKMELFDSDTAEDLEDIIDTIVKNLLKINEHGGSASRIVKGMEKLLRERSTEFIPTDINALVTNHVEIAFQEVRKEYKDFNADIVKNLDEKAEKVSVLPAELGSVIGNLINNACYSVHEKSIKTENHQPVVTITTVFKENELEIKVHDNGMGINQGEMKQLFAPFFTTKPTAKGTGLGLYMSQDIVKTHKGNITVESEEGAFTEFVIIIPG
jgi:signal transduction histidine kinase/ligand-binding sensor domain-containing protein